MFLVEILKIVLAAMGIGILIYLSVSIYGLVTDRNEQQRITENLNAMITSVNSINTDNPSGTFMLLAGEDWHLLSYFNKEGISECSSFCLCFCDEYDCSDEIVCKETSKFVLLKDKEGIIGYKRLEIKEAPVSFNISYLDKEVYPYYSDLSSIPSFYEFNIDKWFWSYGFYKDWAFPTTFTGPIMFEGNEAYKIPFWEIAFIEILHATTDNGINKEKGEELFKRANTRLSKGIVVMQMEG